jgi:predicted transcriptional regulator
MEICLDVLRAMDNGVEKPTHIMNKCNLSYGKFCTMMDVLTKQEMVKTEKKGKRVFFKLTDKGKNVLEYFSKIESPLPFLIIPQSDLNGRQKK